ncbi:hypothetical protein BO70DRAFT_257829, partial [Aspergillus heteromorphus CBS 117.55]
HLPRLLLLHGGGTNARIFRSQCRSLRAALTPYFRLVFVDAPFPSVPGPDVIKVYEKWGPFRCWIPQPPCSNAVHSRGEVVRGVQGALRKAMTDDDARGGRGEWVGVLGFSQGAKVAASLLVGMQGGRKREGGMGLRLRFGVLLAGRAPVVRLEGEDEDEDEDDGEGLEDYGAVLELPTLHVHGMRDPGLSLHRELLGICERGTARLVEWEGEHRVPIRSADVGVVVTEILGMARAAGVL